MYRTTNGAPPTDEQLLALERLHPGVPIVRHRDSIGYHADPAENPVVTEEQEAELRELGLVPL